MIWRGNANYRARDRRGNGSENQGGVGIADQEMGRALLLARGAGTGRRSAHSLPLLRRKVCRQGGRGEGTGDWIRRRNYLAWHRDPSTREWGAICAVE